MFTPEGYAALRRTLNHDTAKAVRRGIMFPKGLGTENRFLHDGDTSDKWELETLEKLRMAVSWGRSAEAEREWGEGRRYSPIRAQMAGINAHILLWYSGAALLSISGVIYPTRSTVEMARLKEEHDSGWRNQFQSDLSKRRTGWVSAR